MRLVSENHAPLRHLLRQRTRLQVRREELSENQIPLLPETEFG